MPVISALRRQRQEDLEIKDEDNLGYIARLYFVSFFCLFVVF
jgi:hypothetical protein